MSSETPTKTSWKAVWSLGLAIFGLILFAFLLSPLVSGIAGIICLAIVALVASLLAIFFGLSAIKMTRRSDGLPYDGSEMAGAGLIMGLLSFALWLAWLFLIIPLLGLGTL